MIIENSYNQKCSLGSLVSTVVNCSITCLRVKYSYLRVYTARKRKVTSELYRIYLASCKPMWCAYSCMQLQLPVCSWFKASYIDSYWVSIMYITNSDIASALASYIAILEININHVVWQLKKPLTTIASYIYLLYLTGHDEPYS